MSLDYKLGDIVDWETLCWPVDEATGEKYMSPVTQTLIFATMAVGIGEITARNAKVWFTRFQSWDDAAGTTRCDPTVTLNDVRAHIGLRTNVSIETARQFAAKLRRLRTRRERDKWRAARIEADA